MWEEKVFASLECFWRIESFPAMAKVLGPGPRARLQPMPGACCLLPYPLLPFLSLGLLFAFSPILPNPVPFFLPPPLPPFFSLSISQTHHYDHIHLHLPNILLFHDVFPAPSIRCKHFLLRTLTALWISLMPLIIFCHVVVFLGLLYCMSPRKKAIVFIRVLLPTGPSTVPCIWW